MLMLMIPMLYVALRCLSFYFAILRRYDAAADVAAMPPSAAFAPDFFATA